MPSGIGFDWCCRRRRVGVVARSGMTAGWSRGSLGGIGSAHRGGMCRRRSVRGRPCGSGTAGTPAMGLGIGCMLSSSPTRTPPGGSTRRLAWTRRSPVPISTRRIFHGSQGDLSNYKNLHGELADHGIGRSRGGLSSKIYQLVDGRGLPLVVNGRCRPGRRLADVSGADRSPAGRPSWARQATIPPGPAPGGQGVLVPGDPPALAHPKHRRRDSRTRRSARTSHPTRLARGQTSRLRRR